MRGLRIAGIVAASVAVVLVVALLLAWLLFDPNDHKARVQSVFREVTGRELRLDGDLSLSLFPWLAIESGTAAISNRKGFGDEPFASLERARLGVRLWPLLSRRRVEFGPVRVEGLVLNLAVARDGSNNWSDLLDRLERKEPAPEPVDADGGDAGPSVASVELRDARVSFADAQAGTRYALTDWNLETGRLRRGEPVDVDTSLRLARNERDLGRLAVRTRVDLTQPDRVLLVGTEGEVRLARAAREALAVALRSPQVVMTSATRDIEVRELEARLGKAVVATNLRIEQRDAGPIVNGDLRLAETDPRALFAALGLDTPRTQDPQALRRLSANSKLAYSSARGLQFDALEVQLDDTRLAGQFGVRPGEPLALRFDLRGAALDLDRYLPPAGAPPSAPKRSRAVADDGRRAYDLRGSIALDRLVVAKVPLQDARLEVRLQDGRVSLEPLRARAFGGSIVTRLQYDLAAAEPSLRVDQQLSGVDVAALLGQSFGLEQLQGRGDGRFSLTSHGANAQALVANLRGPFEFTVMDGAVIGVDLWHEIERAVAAARLTPSAATGAGSGRTKFERFSARGTLAERTLRNDRLEFITDFARVRGRGKVDYGRSALDLDLAARLLKAPQGRLLGVKVSRLKDADIPLRVTGTLAEPKVRPDVSKLLEAMAKDAIKQPLEGKIKEELEKIFKF
ncbi:MAG TPA: AsmA family protein [Steroidobacteraceae bacterium]